MNEMDKGFDQVVNIINQARENAFRKVNEEHSSVSYNVTDERKQGRNYA